MPTPGYAHLVVFESVEHIEEWVRAADNSAPNVATTLPLQHLKDISAPTGQCYLLGVATSRLRDRSDARLVYHEFVTCGAKKKNR